MDKKAKMVFTKEEKSWIAYDWANSVYATIMMAAVFGPFFVGVAGAAGQDGDAWWGIARSSAMLVVALLAPIIGAFSDFPGYRKKIFVVLFALGVGFTFASAFFNDWILLFFGFAISHIGFSSANVVYDASLADVTTKDRMDTISGYGFAFGYIGGSTIPFLVSIALIMFGHNFGIDNTLAIRISVVLTAVWWGLFTIPYLRNVKQMHSIPKPESGSVSAAAFRAILNTAKKIAKNKKILFFLLAYFFYIDGVGTVITMSTVYGAVLGLALEMMIVALLVTQLVAFPCSIIFSRLSQKYGSLFMIRIACVIYLVICITGFIMGFGLEEGLFDINVASTLFWVLATLVGTVQGGIQAISRSYYCQMIPPENSGEFFGFFDIFGRFASIVGPTLYAVIRTATGRPDFAILSIIGLFIMGLTMLAIGNRHFKKVDLNK
jgi:UMF1 family MFS transporter